MKKYIYTAYPHLKQVDTFSKQVAKLLFKRYPQWLPYTSVGTWDNESYLDVRIPAPVRPRDHDILISTASGRLTVYFDLFHTHFYNWHGETLADALDDVYRFLDAIFEEKLVVHITMIDEQVISWQLITPHVNSSNSTEDISQVTQYHGVVSLSGGTFLPSETDKEHNVISYTRSWRGTFDSRNGV